MGNGAATCDCSWGVKNQLSEHIMDKKITNKEFIDMILSLLGVSIFNMGEGTT